MARLLAEAGWELVGEDYEAIFAHGTRPLDWRTKADALLAYAGEVDREAALLSLGTAKVVHGVCCWAPPGEWYGGTYIAWSDQGDAPNGWWAVGEHTQCENKPGPQFPVPGECEESGILCLRLDGHYPTTLGRICALMPESIHLVTAGEGWPWFSRVILAVTVVVL